MAGPTLLTLCVRFYFRSMIVLGEALRFKLCFCADPFMFRFCMIMFLLKYMNVNVNLGDPSYASDHIGLILLLFHSDVFRFPKVTILHTCHRYWLYIDLKTSNHDVTTLTYDVIRMTVDSS